PPTATAPAAPAAPPATSSPGPTPTLAPTPAPAVASPRGSPGRSPAPATPGAGLPGVLVFHSSQETPGSLQLYALRPGRRGARRPGHARDRRPGRGHPAGLVPRWAPARLPVGPLRARADPHRGAHRRRRRPGHARAGQQSPPRLVARRH